MSIKSQKLSRIFLWTGIVLYPVYVTLLCEYIACGGKDNRLNILKNAPQSFIPAVLLILIVFASLLVSTRRAWIASLAGGLPFMLFSAINYFKMQYSVVPFVASDLAFATSLGDITAEFTGDGLVIPTVMIIGVLVYLLPTVCFALLTRKIAINKFVRIWTSGILVIILMFQLVITAPFAYSLAGIDIENTENAAVGLAKNGFLPTFFKSFYNYSNKEDLSQYDVSESAFFTDEKMEKKPNVIVILAEAYWDVNQLKNATFSQNPTAAYDRLSAEGISGTMLSPTIGGGTVRPEFEVLTSLITDGMPEGNSAYNFVTTPYLPSLGSYFENNGYETTFMHTFEKTFYDRDVAYSTMGFDTMLDINDIPYEYRLQGGYVPDRIIGQWVTDTLAENEEPQFIMAITIENHGPYYGKDNRGEVEVTGTDILDEETVNMLGSYSKALKHTDDVLATISDFAKTSGEPTVILFYGDHLPYFGGGYHGFVNGGFIEDGNEANWDEETQNKMHALPFLIWSSEGDIEPVSDIQTAPYYLGQLLLDAIDAPLTPYYEYLQECYENSVPMRAWTTLDEDEKETYNTLKAYSDIYLY